jgi:hypothetical protein
MSKQVGKLVCSAEEEQLQELIRAHSTPKGLALGRSLAALVRQANQSCIA